jgi:Mg/Co/Ni transporter MgtE
MHKRQVPLSRYVFVTLVGIMFVAWSVTPNRILHIPYTTAQLASNFSMKIDPLTNMTKGKLSNNSGIYYTDEDGVIRLSEILRSATPGTIAKLPLNEYSPSMLTKALDSLSPDELAIALSKIYSANLIMALNNTTTYDLLARMTPYDIARILNKLSSDDLAIAFTNHYVEPPEEPLSADLTKNSTTKVISKNTSNLYDINPSGVPTLVMILKTATPGTIAKLPLNQYSPSMLTKALDSLSPDELAIALSKIYSANLIMALNNVTSYDIVRILNKLSSDDLAIALSYASYNGPDNNEYSVDSLVWKLSKQDLGEMLNKASSQDLIILITTLHDVPLDFGDFISLVKKDNIRNMIKNLSADSLDRDVAQALIQHILKSNSTSSGSKYQYDDVIKIIKSFSSPDIVGRLLDSLPSDKREPTINTLTVVQRAEVLSILAKAKAEREWLDSHPNEYCPHFNCAPPAAYAYPSVDFTTMLTILLENATSSQLKEIPLTEYSLGDLAKALNKLPQDKRAEIINILPQDKRAEIINILPQDKRSSITKSLN